MSDITLAQAEAIAAVRRFSRFYTRQLGLLGEALLKSDFSLTEARVLYELAHREAPTATDLCRDLGLDAGYLSRMLKTFDQRGLITRSTSPRDARQTLLALTLTGQAAFAPLDRASQQDVRAMIGGLTPADAAELVAAIRTVEHLLGTPQPSTAPIILRPYRLGDIGWIVHRQAVLYAQEYAWDETYEALAENRTRLDRRTRRNRHGFGLRHARLRNRREAAVAICGANGARARSRPQTGRHLHRVRPRQQLSDFDTMDKRRTVAGTADLPAGRVRQNSL
jgi:DNA-binding MarR family transcriptional regulator